MGFVDLHTHSVYSDGTNTVKEIVELCVVSDINILSLTDHDNIYGLKEAKLLCNKNNITLINGIEFTANYRDEEIHILAYGFDENNNKIADVINKSKELRVERNIKMFQKFKDIGIIIDEKNLNLADNSVITRADISSELIKMGLAIDKNDAFNKYLTEGCITYIKKEAIDFKEILKTINEVGGVSSLAHPNIYSFFNKNLKSSLQELKKHGLNSVECYHSSYNNQTTNTLLGMCNRLGLLKSGGSDYHGTKKKDVFIGKATNSQFINYDDVDELLSSIL